MEGKWYVKQEQEHGNQVGTAQNAWINHDWKLISEASPSLLDCLLSVCRTDGDTLSRCNGPFWVFWKRPRQSGQNQLWDQALVAALAHSEWMNVAIRVKLTCLSLNQNTQDLWETRAGTPRHYNSQIQLSVYCSGTWVVRVVGRVIHQPSEELCPHGKTRPAVSQAPGSGPGPGPGLSQFNALHKTLG